MDSVFILHKVSRDDVKMYMQYFVKYISCQGFWHMHRQCWWFIY